MAKKITKNWDEVDERCPTCNNVTKEAKGINKQNLKKLFSRPSLQDVIVFIMLSACLFLTWAYYNDIEQYQIMFENPGEFCMSYYDNLAIGGNANQGKMNPLEYDPNSFDNNQDG